MLFVWCPTCKEFTSVDSIFATQTNCPKCGNAVVVPPAIEPGIPATPVNPPKKRTFWGYVTAVPRRVFAVVCMLCVLLYAIPKKQLPNLYRGLQVLSLISRPLHQPTVNQSSTKVTLIPAQPPVIAPVPKTQLIDSTLGEWIKKIPALQFEKSPEAPAGQYAASLVYYYSLKDHQEKQLHCEKLYFCKKGKVPADWACVVPVEDRHAAYTHPVCFVSKIIDAQTAIIADDADTTRGQRFYAKGFDFSNMKPQDPFGDRLGIVRGYKDGLPVLVPFTLDEKARKLVLGK